MPPNTAFNTHSRLIKTTESPRKRENMRDHAIQLRNIPRIDR